jgi:hypothetical protein
MPGKRIRKTEKPTPPLIARKQMMARLKLQAGMAGESALQADRGDALAGIRPLRL